MLLKSHEDSKTSLRRFKNLSGTSGLHNSNMSMIVGAMHILYMYDTVDGRNPAPPGMY